MKILELLSDKKRWTQRALARNTIGEPVMAEDQDAVCWCLIGAALKCYPDERERDKVYARFHEATDDRFGMAHFNDFSSYEEVIEAIRKAGV